MSYFDEQASWLSTAVASLALADVDHLVAVDGPYLLYPDSLNRFRSNADQTLAIVGAALGIDIGVTVHVARHPWMGNEIQKRNFLFDIARAALPEMGPEDWFFIIDSDEYVERGAGTKAVLANALEDVAYYRLNEPDGT